MSKIKPVIREVKQAVLDGMAHSKDKLPELTNNMHRHLDDVVKKVEANDKFDSKNKPVEEFELGSYRDLKRRERVGDQSQHDHIPSSAAIRRAKENELGRTLTRAERRELHNDATAVELSDLLHSLSRTFGGKNSQTQIDLDASDLRIAMERDLRTLRQNLTNDGRLSPTEIDRLLNGIRTMNKSRGIG